MPEPAIPPTHDQHHTANHRQTVDDRDNAHPDPRRALPEYCRRHHRTFQTILASGRVAARALARILAGHGRVEPFAIDEVAFQLWPQLHQLHLADLVVRPQALTSAEFTELIELAIQAGVLTGDPRLRLEVTGEAESGYYLLLFIRGETRDGRSQGWTEMDHPPSNADPVDVARHYLTHVIKTANDLLPAAARDL